MATASGEAAGPLVRYATEDDVPLILSLIHELAKYEKATHEVKATEASLRSSLSFPISPNPSTNLASTSSQPKQDFTPGYARTLLLYPPHTNEAAGFALFFTSYSTWQASPGIFLEDLFVRPQYRKHGYGKLLFRVLAREAQRVHVESGGAGVARLGWNVLKWNEPSIGFYTSEAIGAKPTDEWVGMRVEGEGVEKLARSVETSGTDGGR
ncbi:uncharacterized protein KY384_008767 [Bacidia gigantensis]|uniref:uncharacterized protein n=1 Tax=Bacidia gigantensis TaxID=2732470 RepID=UPI001D04B019|nr:uncharacterized protein KY384_008767 [Bacidia gigantensis]KAG8526566.1 hypothetical protein KY384_008767 [Bacidia gigantensis]